MTEPAPSPVLFPHVERVDDSLIVTWRGAPDASVFLSETPDDAGVDVRAPDSPGLAVLALPDPTQRYFVHLFAPGEPFVVVAERLLPLEGPHNVRDLGGYATPNGPTRWGRVLRADNPGRLTPSDVAYLQRLGLATVCDYRADRETKEWPSKLVDVAGVSYQRLPISTGGPDQTSAMESLLRGELKEFTFDDMADAYGQMLHDFSDTLATVIRHVAEQGSGTLLFNCSGGKDRTGLTAALLLLMVGVDDSTVLDDYELSARYLPEARLSARYRQFAEFGIEKQAVAGMFEVRRSTLKRALADLRARYGSVDAYLRDHMGLDDATFAGVQASLVG